MLILSLECSRTDKFEEQSCRPATQALVSDDGWAVVHVTRFALKWVRRVPRPLVSPLNRRLPGISFSSRPFILSGILEITSGCRQVGQETIDVKDAGSQVNSAWHDKTVRRLAR